jgi:hypothetical protein
MKNVSIASTREGEGSSKKKEDYNSFVEEE